MSSRFRGQAGVMIFSAVDADRCQEIATLKCVHCGGHFPLDPKTKHWCGECAGYVCGKDCTSKVPWEQELENIEAGRPLDYRPVIVRG